MNEALITDMWAEPLFWTNRDYNPPQVVITARLEMGMIAPGMYLYLQMNRSTMFSLSVVEVTHYAESRVELLLNCGDKQGAELILSKTFNNDELHLLSD